VNLADQVTVIIPTSPVERHPATDVIEETIDSVLQRLPGVEILVVADGVRPEQQALTKNYRLYLYLLAALCAHDWSNVLLVIADGWGHQANVTRLALAKVRTPLVLFVEHDTPLVGDIEWAPLVELVESGEANVVRFYHEAEIQPEHEHLMVDEESRLRLTEFCDGTVGGSTTAWLRRTMQWSQRPHLASTRFYRMVVDRYFAPSSRTMIEDVMHGIVEVAWREYGEPGWWDWRLWIYTPTDGGDIKRSTHLDWRGDAPKFEMQPAYPGGVIPPVYTAADK